MTDSITIRGKKINYCNQPHLFREAELGKWEPDTFDAIDRFVTEGKSFIDVGAWVGIFSIYAALLGAKVYAIEPDVHAYCDFKENMWLNDNLKTGITILNYALSNCDGIATLSTQSSFGNSESSLVVRPNTIGRQTVMAYTLRSIISSQGVKDICLIKIDCEGSESIFIDENFRDTLIEHDCPPIHIAFHPAWLPDFDNTVQKFIDVLFPIYDFESVAIKKKYLAEEFREAMLSRFDHTFLLTAKK